MINTTTHALDTACGFTASTMSSADIGESFVRAKRTLQAPEFSLESWHPFKSFYEAGWFFKVSVIQVVYTRQHT